MKQDKVLCLSPPQGKLNNYEIYKTRLISLAMPAWGMKAGRSGASHLASHLAWCHSLGCLSPAGNSFSQQLPPPPTLLASSPERARPEHLIFHWAESSQSTRSAFLLVRLTDSHYRLEMCWTRPASLVTSWYLASCSPSLCVWRGPGCCPVNARPASLSPHPAGRSKPLPQSGWSLSPPSPGSSSPPPAPSSWEAPPPQLSQVNFAHLQLGAGRAVFNLQ